MRHDPYAVVPGPVELLAHCADTTRDHRRGPDGRHRSDHEVVRSQCGFSAGGLVLHVDEQLAGPHPDTAQLAGVAADVGYRHRVGQMRVLTGGAVVRL
ncbi:MAG: hypothetical protein ACRDRI_07535 [Pseudonocardiaceae bacterium]